MENALRLCITLDTTTYVVVVLILIFLENALRLRKQKDIPKVGPVLILIFLENALRPSKRIVIQSRVLRLNPYFFGKCSTADTLFSDLGVLYNRLNPYFFGKCSTAVKYIVSAMVLNAVLILIFLENALRR